MQKIGSALISVYHKDGLEPLARELHRLDVKLYSTGGTQSFLEGLGLPVTAVETVTGFPSILEGRVKTLHPLVFGGILWPRNRKDDRDTVERFGIPSFDSQHPKFDAKRYWRGPSWSIINYLVARGLAEFGFERKAERIRMATRAAIQQSGFHEYFNPLTGEGYGGANFTWTAAIWLAWASPKTDAIGPASG